MPVKHLITGLWIFSTTGHEQWTWGKKVCDGIIFLGLTSIRDGSSNRDLVYKTTVLTEDNDLVLNVDETKEHLGFQESKTWSASHHQKNGGRWSRLKATCSQASATQRTLGEWKHWINSERAQQKLYLNCWRRQTRLATHPSLQKTCSYQRHHWHYCIATPSWMSKISTNDQTGTEDNLWSALYGHFIHLKLLRKCTEHQVTVLFKWVNLRHFRPVSISSYISCSR